MKRLRRFVPVVLVAFLVGCGQNQPASQRMQSGSPAPAAAQDKIQIKVGHVLAPTEPTQKAAEEWARRVSERTGGRVELQIFPNSQLGSDKDTAEQARLGANVIAYTSPGYLAEFVPDFGILGGPFLFENFDEAKKVLNSRLVQDWREKLIRDKGLRLLAVNWYFGERHLITNKVVRGPDDLKGLKIRALPVPLWVETIKAMGATPTPLAWAEVYPGMQQKVIDGAEAPYSTLYSSKLYEVGKHISSTGHFLQFNFWMIGEKFYQTLPKDVQKALEEEAVTAGELMTQLTMKADAEYRQKLQEAGVTITVPDREAFRKATRSVYAVLGSKWTPGLYDEIARIKR